MEEGRREKIVGERKRDDRESGRENERKRKCNEREVGPRFISLNIAQYM